MKYSDFLKLDKVLVNLNGDVYEDNYYDKEKNIIRSKSFQRFVIDFTDEEIQVLINKNSLYKLLKLTVDDVPHTTVHKIWAVNKKNVEVNPKDVVFDIGSITGMYSEWNNEYNYYIYGKVL